MNTISQPHAPGERKEAPYYVQWSRIEPTNKKDQRREESQEVFYGYLYR